MPIRLDYEELISELQGLLGRKVMVTIYESVIDEESTPVAMLYGRLHAGSPVDVDFAKLSERWALLEGESLLFYVRGPDDSTFGLMIVREEDFFEAWRHEDGELEFKTGLLRFAVLLDE